MECLSIAVPRRAAVESAEVESLFGHGSAPAVVPNYEGTGKEGGFSPQNLRSAYKLPSTGGSGQTVAIVDAFDDPNAEADLNVYRQEYGLGECTKANGCFKKVNQEGKEEDYPQPGAIEEHWAIEMSLDVDMVSAICPECHILLVEANTSEDENMYAAEDEAASWEEAGTKRKATEISNSWGQEESPEETSSDAYFDHPGTPITVAAGDHGYGVEYPAASPDVISVGGTALMQSSDTRGWSEEVWSATGSGCSEYEEKPTWQTQAGCSHRIDNDVSAVASPETPVSIYDSYERSGWELVGGTSAAAPIIAGVEALSSSAFRSTGPSAFTRAGQGGELFDVTEGENGSCGGTYLCQAEVGYDAPTGWGTPDGTPSLPVAITEAATVVSPSEVTLRGFVDPGALKTEYHFEYGETTSYGTSIPIPDESVGSGTEYVEVKQPIEGVKERTSYHYRITATNAEGTFHGLDQTFGTTPPSASTEGATEISGNGVTLNAAVNPEDLETTYYFEYGTSTSYGSKMPLRGQATGSGTENTEVNTAISGLSGDETYHFRVVAKNVAGTAYGEDETFTTAPSEWNVQTLSQPAESGEEREAYGVSCAQPEMCVAVGSYWSLGVHTDVTLAEIWNGATWSAMETPNPPGLEEGWMYGRYAVLRGVSCLTTSDCVAVGYYRNTGDVGWEWLERTGEQVEPLAERWNGSTWTVMPVTVPSGADASWLEGVSCTSATTECTAVGSSFKDSSGVEETLVERWNGSEWTAQLTPPNPAGVSAAAFTAVSCFSRETCTAVGFTNGRLNAIPLAEQWKSGSGWSVQSTDTDSGDTDSGGALNSVSCTAANACTAVGFLERSIDGYYNATTLADRWNGAEWSVQTTYPSQQGGSLGAVSCTSSSDCTAVGYFRDETAQSSAAEALGERWNGATWTALELTGLPAASGMWRENWLHALSCAEPGACVAVGDTITAPIGGRGTEVAIGEELAHPFAYFSMKTPSPTAGEPVTFDGSFSSDPGGTIVSYEWSFGDGSTGTGADPSHTYAKPGAYTVTLTITDNEGKTWEFSNVVTVAEAPPTAAFSVGTSSPTAGQAVALDSSAPSEPEGTIVSYEWSFGDGVDWDGC